MPVYPFSSAWLEVYINEPAVNKDVRQIRYKATTITGNNKVAWLLKAISFIDLTSLNGDDTVNSITDLCAEAVTSTVKLPFEWDEPLHTAAVCVYPSRVDDTVKVLKDIDKKKVIKVASVAGGFPSGQYHLRSRLEEVHSVLDGADEIDIVIDRSLALNNKWEQLYKELKIVREICDNYNKAYNKKRLLKTILSTGELFNLKHVYKASMVAMMAGADFIKTSTGKEAINATLPVGVVMCRAIKAFQQLTSQEIGFKPAGGIKTAQNALEWMVLIKEELGNEWLSSDHFRIGASSLLNNIINEICKTYQPNDDQEKDDNREHQDLKEVSKE